MVFNVSKEDKYKTGVYVIRNMLNKKIYVGSTSNNFYTRFHQHKSGYLNNNHQGVILKKAFEKYGFENFIFEILCVCEKEECIKMEQWYIDKGVDYNCALIAGSLLGYSHPSGSKTRTIVGGLHHGAVKVFRFSLLGEYVDNFPSISEAISFLKVSRKGLSHITQACKGITYSAFGFRWSFTPNIINRPPRINRRKCIVINNGEITKEFSGQYEAANFIKSLGFKCNQARISRSILKTGEKVYGFTIKLK